MEPLLTIKEAAHILRLNPMTIYRWAKAGKIKTSRIGKTDLRIAKDELYRIMQKRPDFRDQCQREATMFLWEHQDYLCTPENETAMLNWIDDHNLPITVATLTRAYQDLWQAGLLELKQDSPAIPEASNGL